MYLVQFYFFFGFDVSKAAMVLTFAAAPKFSTWFCVKSRRCLTQTDFFICTYTVQFDFFWVWCFQSGYGPNLRCRTQIFNMILCKKPALFDTNWLFHLYLVQFYFSGVWCFQSGYGPNLRCRTQIFNMILCRNPLPFDTKHLVGCGASCTTHWQAALNH